MILESKSFLVANILTYNRPGRLAELLCFFSENDNSDVVIRVYDNASDGRTEQVVNSYHGKIKRLEYIKRAVNIGASPNYGDALIRSESEYVWMLGDDDIYDGIAYSDMLRRLRTREFDVMLIGAPGIKDWEWGRECAIGEHILQGARFYHTATFFPAIIFRKKLLREDCFRRYYAACGNLWPQLSVVDDLVSQNLRLAVVQAPVVFRRDAEDYGKTPYLWFVKNWIFSVIKTIDDRRRRKRALDDVLGDFDGRQWKHSLIIILGIFIDCCEGSIECHELRAIAGNYPARFISVRCVSYVASLSPIFVNKAIGLIFKRVLLLLGVGGGHSAFNSYRF